MSGSDGPPEKDQDNWHLVGGLAYGTAGSASGPGERAGSNPGTAPQAGSAVFAVVEVR
jgi:hypothetical protein